MNVIIVMILMIMIIIIIIIIIIIFLRKNLEAVPGKHSIDSLQKTAILGTSPLVQEKYREKKTCDKRHSYLL